ncbi:hypothetical protein Tco_0508500 [Tanacetum coccineum]
MKDKVEYKGKNVVGAFMNVPLFVGNFSIIIDFEVVEIMDAYQDKDKGDVIFGKPFCKSAYVEARWFDGFITVSDGNDSVTYQMARSHLRFKHLSNEQCNKIWPLLQEVILFYNRLDVQTRQILNSKGAIPSKTAANAKKVNEKVYAAQVGCKQSKGPHYTKDCPLKEEGKTLKEPYYTQFGGPFQGGGYRAAALGFY